MKDTWSLIGRSGKLVARVTLLVGAVSGSCLASDATNHFEAKVRPVLAAQCYRCHTKAQKGGLRLDSRAGLLRGGKSGPAVIPGAPRQSLLIQAIRYQHDALKMPPRKALPAHVVADIIRWVADGAVWSAAPGATLTDQPISDSQREFWSFQPVIRPVMPSVSVSVKESKSQLRDANKERNPIDAFILAKLKSNNLIRNDAGDRRSLIRRATYDLIGLPPRNAEIEAYLGDGSPRAFERVIERLLASRHYGERWGQHWLDLVRYADTAGDAADFPVPEAYKYRNYVIDAFNNDKPYDDFIREQIAGDLLPSKNDEERWEQTIATGYIAIARRIGVSPQNLRHITIENTLDNLGKTFLGLTVGCARCHDHKFDPIPTEDYYALYGIFDSSVYPHAGAEHKPHRQDFVYRVGEQRAAEILQPHRAALEPWDRRERAQFEVYQSFQKRKIANPNLTRASTWKQLLEVRAERASVAESFPDLEIAYAIQEGEPHDVNVMQAGDPSKKSQGAVVRRGFLQILGGAKLPDAEIGSGRLQLAEWIVDPKNPLTARVMVNRIWHHHFGRGLVRTTSDFGVRGTPPTHPQLLDYLAAVFVERAWSIKQMHRLIMLSDTYQLSTADVSINSAIDPQNNFLWRANRRRLDAEQIRDSMLTFSGQLDVTMGGCHPFPHRLSYFYRQHEPFTAVFPTNRRSVYLMQPRIQKNPFLDLFDGSDGNLHVGERKSSATTLQALYLMNAKFVHAQAAAMSDRLLDRGGDLPTHVAWAYQTVFGRPPQAQDIARAAIHLEQATGQTSKTTHTGIGIQKLAWAGYLRAMISSNEFMFLD